MSSTASFWPGSRAGVTNIGQRIGYGISYDHFADVQRSHERPGNLRVPFVQGKSSWAHVSYRNNRVISGVGFCPFCNWNSNRRDRLGPLRIPIRRFVDFRQPRRTRSGFALPRSPQSPATSLPGSPPASPQATEPNRDRRSMPALFTSCSCARMALLLAPCPYLRSVLILTSCGGACRRRKFESGVVLYTATTSNSAMAATTWPERAFGWIRSCTLQRGRLARNHSGKFP
jgi:hypothetical protein